MYILTLPRKLKYLWTGPKHSPAVELLSQIDKFHSIQWFSGDIRNLLKCINQMYADSTVRYKKSKMMIFQSNVFRLGSELWAFSYFDAAAIIFPDLTKELMGSDLVMGRNSLSSFMRFRNGSTSRIAIDNAIYSASVVLSAISVYNLLCQ